jgi:23S rRNA pseudouridine1911/1915/1917 synthase
VEMESENLLSFLVGEDEKEERVDVYIPSHAKDLTRSRVQELIRQRLVHVNLSPVKASHRLRPGDRIDVTLPPVRPCALKPEQVAFTVVYEDPSLLVIDKPPGLVVHPAPGHATGTLVHGLLRHCRDLSGIGGVERPGIVHRLDKDTSGLVVVAKSDRVHTALSAQFKAGAVNKTYVALVHGILPHEKGVVDLPIARHPQRRKEMAVSPVGKKAVTHWEKIEELGGLFTLLLVRPRTGRTHQIRVHLSHEGHPIVGDSIYGQRKNRWQGVLAQAAPEIPRQMLHARKLGFIHPESGKYCEFEAPLPADMMKYIEDLRGLGLPRGMVHRRARAAV